MMNILMKKRLRYTMILLLLLEGTTIYAAEDSLSLQQTMPSTPPQSRDQYLYIETTTNTNSMQSSSLIPFVPAFPLGMSNTSVVCPVTPGAPPTQMTGIAEWSAGGPNDIPFQFAIQSYPKTIAPNFNYTYYHNCSATFAGFCTSYGWIQMYTTKDTQQITCANSYYYWENSGQHI